MTVFKVYVAYDDFSQLGRSGFGLAGLRTGLTKVFDGVVRRSERVGSVAELMGLGLEEVRLPVYQKVEVEVEPGDVVYVTGESGGGKSLLLRHLAAEMEKHPDFAPVITSWNIKVKRDRPLIDLVGGDVYQAVETLSAAGLSDVFTWFRCFDELSDGQRMRFIFAKALDSGAKTVVLDEFCSSLDRETAKATAYTIQRLARKRKLTLVAATAVNDLLEDLNPSLYIVKHFGPQVSIKRLKPEPRPCSLLNKVVVEEGSAEDWRLLSFLHYRSHRIGGVVRIFRAVLEGRVVGVVVYSNPYLKPAGFSRFFDREWYLSQRFGNVLRIQRVVVHPSFRGIGVAKKLLQESMPRLDVAFVEILSSMERLIPFTKGLMKHVTIETASEKKLKLQEFKQLFGIELQRHGVAEVMGFIARCNQLNKLRKWLEKNLVYFTELEKITRRSDAKTMAKLLKMIKSSASPKVYGVWVNPSPKHKKVVEKTLKIGSGVFSD
ncbi:MAG: GNAT family N-acetyltransferase [Candidatus Caldarchaeum sp.]